MRRIVHLIRDNQQPQLRQFSLRSKKADTVLNMRVITSGQTVMTLALPGFQIEHYAVANRQ
ncbi:Uncharacterised protein [Salmonella enterica subsp. enterica serovar Bovismorbificans]|uniref:Uncharacterized protein n=1 Tax=Salmonella enterica subsp. enterica serovar Bovismorbificans TaxID=58097 RepID=A0A655ER11_SALET|nr:Uncharacterised protein [Salmonella enterica subsp. enterica serovar Bovismorbificans]CPR50038.1 Uncharacterised protein [Salmonella enterica subsp. enterica serovar Bovismorbificans]